MRWHLMMQRFVCCFFVVASSRKRSEFFALCVLLWRTNEKIFSHNGRESSWLSATKKVKKTIFYCNEKKIYFDLFQRALPIFSQ